MRAIVGTGSGNNNGCERFDLFGLYWTVLSGMYIASVALTGRVPVKVEGPVAKGDLMVSNGNGRARACVDAVPVVGTILGKSLENFTGGEGTIEVVIGKQ